MTLEQYLAKQITAYEQSSQQCEKAKRRMFVAERIFQNKQIMGALSDEELTAKNNYWNGRGSLWLEENDWVYGLLTKTIRYARENYLPGVADRIYERVHALQKKIRMRKMREEEYLKLKSKSAEDLADYLLCQRK